MITPVSSITAIIERQRQLIQSRYRQAQKEVQYRASARRDRTQSDYTNRLAGGRKISSDTGTTGTALIAQRLNTRAQSYRPVLKNIHYGQELLKEADKDLGSINRKLYRMRELAEQVANQGAIDTEAVQLNTTYQSLMEQMDNLAKTSDYRGKKLLSGELNLDLFLGIDNSDGANFNITITNSDKNGLNLTDTSITSTSGAQSALSAVNDAIDAVELRQEDARGLQKRLKSAVNVHGLVRLNAMLKSKEISELNLEESRELSKKLAGSIVGEQVGRAASKALQAGQSYPQAVRGGQDGRIAPSAVDRQLSKVRNTKTVKEKKYRSGNSSPATMDELTNSIRAQAITSDNQKLMQIINQNAQLKSDFQAANITNTKQLKQFMVQSVQKKFVGNKLTSDFLAANMDITRMLALDPGQISKEIGQSDFLTEQLQNGKTITDSLKNAIAHEAQKLLKEGTAITTDFLENNLDAAVYFLMNPDYAKNLPTKALKQWYPDQYNYSDEDFINDLPANREIYKQEIARKAERILDRPQTLDQEFMENNRLFSQLVVGSEIIEEDLDYGSFINAKSINPEINFSPYDLLRSFQAHAAAAKLGEDFPLDEPWLKENIGMALVVNRSSEVTDALRQNAGIVAGQFLSGSMDLSKLTAYTSQIAQQINSQSSGDQVNIRW